MVPMIERMLGETNAIQKSISGPLRGHVFEGGHGVPRPLERPRRPPKTTSQFDGPWPLEGPLSEGHFQLSRGIPPTDGGFQASCKTYTGIPVGNNG